jgi:hypothetical protein
VSADIRSRDEWSISERSRQPFRAVTLTSQEICDTMEALSTSYPGFIKAPRALITGS